MEQYSGHNQRRKILWQVSISNFSFRACGLTWSTDSIDRYVLSKCEYVETPLGCYSVWELVLDVMFIRELVSRLPDPTPVVACTVNPGFCRSRLFRDAENKWYTRLFSLLLSHAPLSRSSEEGSRTLLHAAIGGEGDAFHGRYLSGCEVLEESSYLFTPEGKAFSRRLWVRTGTSLSVGAIDANFSYMI